MKQHIPLLDLKAQYKSLKSEIDKEILEVLNSSQFILGSKVEEFEKKYAKYCGTRYTVALDSGLSALELGMRALGIGQGDEVIVPTNSFIASASPVSFTGATPVFVDCNEGTFNIDVNKIKEKITKKTKAIMPVHLYGQPADMQEVKSLANKYKLFVVEDACQAHGAKYKNKRVGSFGHFAAFSFYPGKNLGAYGDAGCLTTNNKKLDEKVRMMRNYGQEKKYYHKLLAWNKRMDTIQAAVLLIKLKRLDKWNSSRARHAKLYNKFFKNTPVKTPITGDNRTHMYHQYVVRVKNRNKVQKHLLSKGVSTGIHYPIPIHLQESYKHLGYKRGDFPVAEKLAKEIISLPIYPELTKVDIEYIVNSVKEAL